MEAKASLFLVRSPCLALSFFLIEGTGHQDPWPPVKSANGTTATQNRAIEKIATLLNQAIEVEIKQAHTGMLPKSVDWRRSSNPSPRGERWEERR